MSKPASTLTAGRPSARSNKAATLASLADEASTKRVNFELPTEQHTKLKIYAAKTGRSITDILRELVRSLDEKSD